MTSPTPSVRIGIAGVEPTAINGNRPWGIWPTGYPAAVAAAGAEPVTIEPTGRSKSWMDRLQNIQGLVYAGHATGLATAEEEALLRWCREHKFPILAIDNGMLGLNATFGGANYQELAREFPEGLQHRHPPEEGLRHAINVERGTFLAELYGDGEIVVNSQHRRGICRLARGFQVSGRALDGVIEAVEWEGDDWFALAVQWRPASSFASGLDIQLFRGLVDRCGRKGTRLRRPAPAARSRKRPLAKCG